jgi:ubiquinone/menaquinone biosynthesis C-methylase UbiE
VSPPTGNGRSEPVDWSRLARLYRRQTWLERSSLNTLLEMLEPGPQDRLLDVGTGTGELLRALAARPDRPHEVVGADPCRDMLDRVPALPAGWETTEARGERLPFPDASFDLVTATYLLHVIDPSVRQAVIAEALRVLRPGGRFACITIAPPLTKTARLLTAPGRMAADRFPRQLVGLRPLDPAEDLADAGFIETGRRRDFRGYPALCLLAAKPG